MDYIQYKIELPANHSYFHDRWVETIVGNVIQPITVLIGQRRFWFSRYENNGNRHMLFRFETDNFLVVKESIDEVIASAGLVPDNGIYDLEGDLGSNRFAKSRSMPSDRLRRAGLVFNYLHSICSLFIDNLVLADPASNQYELDQCSDQQNPLGSVFESLHHLFCNITEVPLEVIVIKRNNTTSIMSYLYYTHVAQPTDEWFPVRVRF